MKQRAMPEPRLTTQTSTHTKTIVAAMLITGLALSLSKDWLFCQSWEYQHINPPLWISSAYPVPGSAVDTKNTIV
jgi:hypothetical protein